MTAGAGLAGLALLAAVTIPGGGEERSTPTPTPVYAQEAVALVSENMERVAAAGNGSTPPAGFLLGAATVERPLKSAEATTAAPGSFIPPVPALIPGVEFNPALGGYPPIQREDGNLVPADWYNAQVYRSDGPQTADTLASLPCLGILEARPGARYALDASHVAFAKPEDVEGRGGGVKVPGRSELLVTTALRLRTDVYSTPADAQASLVERAQLAEGCARGEVPEDVTVLPGTEISTFPSKLGERSFRYQVEGKRTVDVADVFRFGNVVVTLDAQAQTRALATKVVETMLQPTLDTLAGKGQPAPPSPQVVYPSFDPDVPPTPRASSSPGG